MSKFGSRVHVYIILEYFSTSEELVTQRIYTNCTMPGKYLPQLLPHIPGAYNLKCSLPWMAMFVHLPRDILYIDGAVILFFCIPYVRLEKLSTKHDDLLHSKGWRILREVWYMKADEIIKKWKAMFFLSQTPLVSRWFCQCAWHWCYNLIEIQYQNTVLLFTRNLISQAKIFIFVQSKKFCL